MAIIIDKDELENLYIGKGLNITKCSKILNCAPMTIWKKLNKFHIPIRFKRIHIEKRQLIKLYTQQKLSTLKVAKILGYSAWNIQYQLKKFGVPRRILKEANIGHPAWNKGTKGIMPEPWNKGKKGLLVHSESSRKKISEGLTGIKRSEDFKKKHRGENHWNWKGGVAPFIVKIRNSFKYRQWHSDIFYRDDFTCQKCGKRGGDLEVHHIESYTFIIEINDVKTFEQAMACKELWNINNGETLCKQCHKLMKKEKCKREKNECFIKK